MQYTSHYNLNLPEGTDIVNPLVQDNPNYTAIDTALYNNKVRVVGNATEVKSGTVHAITRSDSDIDVMRFTATGDWITGDTMTVDGTPVSVYLQDGTAPLTGAYVINTEVVAVINGSRVTLYGAQKLPGYTASDISYDNTGSSLTASDVQDAIDEVWGQVDSTPIKDIVSGVFLPMRYHGNNPGNIATAGVMQAVKTYSGEIPRVVFLNPNANVDITMMYAGGVVYAISASYTGAFTFDAIEIY